MRFNKIIGIFMILIIVGGGIGCMNKKEFKQEMFSYLRNKYNQDFEESFYEDKGFLFKELSGSDKMVVRPKENKELYLTVFADSKGKQFYDNYGTAVQSLKFTQLYAGKIEDLDNRKKTFRFVVRTSADIENKEGLNYDVERLIKEQSKGDLELELYLGIVCEEVPDKTKESKMLYEIYSYMKEFEKSNNKDMTAVVAYIKPGAYEDAKLFTSMIPIYNASWNDLGKDKIYYTVRFEQSETLDSPNYFLDKFKSVER